MYAVVEKNNGGCSCGCGCQTSMRLTAVAVIRSITSPDEIPAQLLKIVLNLWLLLCLRSGNNLFDSEVALKFYKSSLVCPIYKKGDKISSMNYRPDSLTSYTIKLLERILKKSNTWKAAIFCPTINMVLGQLGALSHHYFPILMVSYVVCAKAVIQTQSISTMPRPLIKLTMVF